MSSPRPGMVALTTFATIKTADVVFTVVRGEDGTIAMISWDDVLETGTTLHVRDAEELRKFARGILKGLAT